MNYFLFFLNYESWSLPEQTLDAIGTENTIVLVLGINEQKQTVHPLGIPTTTSTEKQKHKRNMEQSFQHPSNLWF